MKFPDQDLLALHFKGRIRFLGYEYNALKTLRECHADMWQDDKVKNVHYILDKYVFLSRCRSLKSTNLRLF